MVSEEVAVRECLAASTRRRRHASSLASSPGSAAPQIKLYISQEAPVSKVRAGQFAGSRRASIPGSSRDTVFLETLLTRASLELFVSWGESRLAPLHCASPYPGTQQHSHRVAFFRTVSKYVALGQVTLGSFLLSTRSNCSHCIYHKKLLLQFTPNLT